MNGFDNFSIGRMLILGALVFLAGFVDAIAGGGGLITLPAYLSAGLSPALLLGTNKFSSTIGTAVAAIKYGVGLKMNLRARFPAVLAALLGSAAGAFLALFINPEFLQYIVIAVLPFALYFIVAKHVFPVKISPRPHPPPSLILLRQGFDGHELRRAGPPLPPMGGKDEGAGAQQLNPGRFVGRSAIIAFAIGCYDGFLGPGTGAFMAVAFGFFCRYDILKATATAKICNLSSNVAALAVFLVSGRVNILLGIVMGLTGMLGNYAGAHLGLAKGARIIRPLLIAVCAALFVKLLVKAF